MINITLISILLSISLFANGQILGIPMGADAPKAEKILKMQGVTAYYAKSNNKILLVTKGIGNNKIGGYVPNALWFQVINNKIAACTVFFDQNEVSLFDLEGILEIKYGEPDIYVNENTPIIWENINGININLANAKTKDGDMVLLHYEDVALQKWIKSIKATNF